LKLDLDWALLLEHFDSLLHSQLQQTQLT